MVKPLGKKTVLLVCLSFLAGSVFAQGMPIALNAPDLSRGLPVMKALSLRASAAKFETNDLSLQDLSDLLWAANGINRPDTGKKTAPSSMNAQDIDIYVVMKNGVYLYNAKNQNLEPVAEGDYRKLAAGRQGNFATAPVFCLLISDVSRFKSGDDSVKMISAAEDAGIVSQNISIFCAGAGLATRPRATMDQDQLRQVLKLKDSQRLMLNHPVSYNMNK
jgi:nitroreductase